MAIYIDSLFLLNFIVNYLLLLSAAKVSGWVFRRLRLILGAAVGAVYSVAVLLPGFYFLSGPGGKALMCAVMVALAFGLGRHTLRLGLITLGASFALAGAAWLASLAWGGAYAGIGSLYVPVDMKTLLLVAVVAYVGLGAVYRRTASAASRSISPADISLSGKRVTVNCLTDTGNSLKDPMTNEPVTVVGYEVLGALTSLKVDRDADPVSLVQPLKALCPGSRPRLIPFSSVGEAGGLLLAIRCDSLQFNGRCVKDALVAFSPNRLSSDGSYNAISGPV